MQENPVQIKDNSSDIKEKRFYVESKMPASYGYLMAAVFLLAVSGLVGLVGNVVRYFNPPEPYVPSLICTQVENDSSNIELVCKLEAPK